MHRLLLPLIALLAAPAFAQAGPGSSPGQALAGDWSGTLDAGGQPLTLILHLAPAEGGTYVVTMDVPQQGAYGFPVGTGTVSGDTLAFAAEGIGAAFEGVAAEDGAAIEGTWTQGGRSLPLTLTPYEASAEASEARKPAPKYERGDLSGDWAAALALPTGGEVRLSLHLTRTDDGYEAALTGPGGERQPFDTAHVNGRSVTLSIAMPPIEIVGTVSADEATIEGEWRQGGQKLPVTFTRG